MIEQLTEAERLCCHMAQWQVSMGALRDWREEFRRIERSERSEHCADCAALGEEPSR